MAPRALHEGSSDPSDLYLVILFESKDAGDGDEPISLERPRPPRRQQQAGANVFAGLRLS